MCFPANPSTEPLPVCSTHEGCPSDQAAQRTIAWCAGSGQRWLATVTRWLEISKKGRDAERRDMHPPIVVACMGFSCCLTFSKPSAPPTKIRGPSLVEAVSISHIPGPHDNDIFTPSGSDMIRCFLACWRACSGHVVSCNNHSPSIKDTHQLDRTRKRVLLSSSAPPYLATARENGTASSDSPGGNQA